MLCTIKVIIALQFVHLFIGKWGEQGRQSTREGDFLRQQKISWDRQNVLKEKIIFQDSIPIITQLGISILVLGKY